MKLDLSKCEELLAILVRNQMEWDELKRSDPAEYAKRRMEAELVMLRRSIESSR